MSKTLNSTSVETLPVIGLMVSPEYLPSIPYVVMFYFLLFTIIVNNENLRIIRNLNQLRFKLFSFILLYRQTFLVSVSLIIKNSGVKRVHWFSKRKKHVSRL